MDRLRAFLYRNPYILMVAGGIQIGYVLGKWGYWGILLVTFPIILIPIIIDIRDNMTKEERSKQIKTVILAAVATVLLIAVYYLIKTNFQGLI